MHKNQGKERKKKRKKNCKCQIEGLLATHSRMDRSPRQFKYCYESLHLDIEGCHVYCPKSTSVATCFLVISTPNTFQFKIIFCVKILNCL